MFPFSTGMPNLSYPRCATCLQAQIKHIKTCTLSSRKTSCVCSSALRSVQWPNIGTKTRSCQTDLLAAAAGVSAAPSSSVTAATVKAAVVAAAAQLQRLQGVVWRCFVFQLSLAMAVAMWQRKNSLYCAESAIASLCEHRQQRNHGYQKC